MKGRQESTRAWFLFFFSPEGLIQGRLRRVTKPGKAARQAGRQAGLYSLFFLRQAGSYCTHLSRLALMEMAASHKLRRLHQDTPLQAVGGVKGGKQKRV